MPKPTATYDSFEVDGGGVSGDGKVGSVVLLVSHVTMAFPNVKRIGVDKAKERSAAKGAM